MERGLRAPLSPHEEVSFRRVALGISKAELLPARDVERLQDASATRDFQTSPPCSNPKNRMRPSRNWPLSLQRHAAS
jgi:hypothetical protein